jgi:hypothetical protein
MTILKKLTFTALILTATVYAQQAPELPDLKMTPGAVRTTNPDDVCSRPGHKVSTKDVRNVPESVKKAVYKAYGNPGGNHTGFCAGPRGCEVDHLISLELGGSNDITNLWPTPYVGVWNASMKDRLENKLHYMVCKGEIPLTQAQHEIATNWKAAWVKYVNKGNRKD